MRMDEVPHRLRFVKVTDFPVHRQHDSKYCRPTASSSQDEDRFFNRFVPVIVRSEPLQERKNEWIYPATFRGYRTTFKERVTYETLQHLHRTCFDIERVYLGNHLWLSVFSQEGL